MLYIHLTLFLIINANEFIKYWWRQKFHLLMSHGSCAFEFRSRSDYVDSIQFRVNQSKLYYPNPLYFHSEMFTMITITAYEVLGQNWRRKTSSFHWYVKQPPECEFLPWSQQRWRYSTHRRISKCFEWFLILANTMEQSDIKNLIREKKKRGESRKNRK